MSKNTRRQHMSVKWHEIVRTDSDKNALSAPLKEKTTLVGRIGIMMLSVGTGAWRVRSAMNKIARTLGISCNVSIGLTSITYTCIEGSNHYSQTIALPTTGVNTDKLTDIELFVEDFPKNAEEYSVEHMHQILDEIEKKKLNYAPWLVGLAAAIACCAFTFLLGGGPVEMICAFIGAGLGNFVRRLLNDRKITIFATVAIPVSVSCLSYVVAITLAELAGVQPTHHAGYICAMLFVIPGFPLITGGIDLAKLDIKSGLERITYALLIISVATLTGWVTAMFVHFNPADFLPMELPFHQLLVFRAIASFAGVYGFSLMFNSTQKMAVVAGFIGVVTNVLRLELIDMLNMPIDIAAFIGAFFAGVIASLFTDSLGFPRITLTVPSIVIMVPGMFMYKAIYFMGLGSISIGAHWLVKAFLVVVALPIGLVFARILTDRDFRHVS